jgi:hypothetical protein
MAEAEVPAAQIAGSGGDRDSGCYRLAVKLVEVAGEIQ